MEIVMFLGMAIAFVGNVMILIAAFRDSILWGLGSLCVPLVSLIFVITHWSETRKGFFILLVGAILAGIGAAASQPPPQP